ncbi:chaperone DnaJ-domain superfamily protein [Klebsormidium nitens]|uniref:Chaperone DnaJ-domain superfamily protein n=1 Tax=Klebsormidium nitens TaxID=105231 RepID=A0A1Y1HRC0_KLENI|nr:chaperone DnaJ-domain superfamily protein [Klebsormidium nitens]|eukprot:GAQ78368.1 chaperone DnaJ-domain superfamily protein [Klebsormidium nitens]
MARGKKRVIEEESSEAESDFDEEPSPSGQEVEPQNEKSLYEVLGVSKSASQAEVKKAYHRMALILHPDKNPGNEDAKEKFQVLQRVFSVLGDPEKRKVYDQTGSLEDSELSGDQFNNLYDYYRSVYQKVTAEDIDSYEASYRGSALETEELKGYYKRFKGDMRKVFGWLVCSREDLDSHRFKETLDQAIAEGSLEEYPRYRKWAKGVAKKPKPAEDPLARPQKKSIKSNGALSDLTALIRKGQAERNSDFFSKLEEKYGIAKGGKNKGRASANEPSEEEFQAAQQRVLHGGAVKPKKHRAARVE